METNFALLTGEFPFQRASETELNVLFVVSLNILFNEQSRFRSLRCHDTHVMSVKCKLYIAPNGEWARFDATYQNFWIINDVILYHWIWGHVISNYQNATIYTIELNWIILLWYHQMKAPDIS